MQEQPKIVVIGGGTGLSVLLRGLKNYTKNITAIVTVADDGGSSGILREDLGMLAPGDIRSCLLALANTEPMMEKLLQYRFTEGNLKNQSFGNLFIAAMNGICGNFELAIKEMNNVLAVTGKVLPMTLEDVRLKARLNNDVIIKGESYIPEYCMENEVYIEQMYIEPEICKPSEEAITAIHDADIVVLGPGSLFTSIIPNLLIEGITKAIDKSKAKCVYISNVMTQPGETDNYTVTKHVKGILNHSQFNIIDYVIANSENIPNQVLLKYYKKDGAKPVILTEKDNEQLKDLGITLIQDYLVDIKKNYIRHDADKLSKLILSLLKNY
ncbi:gluconeogenesis factor YvcK family protein [Abyssisolibacter fermentans]|uniref:gluconeogenesis factor YvcK family protein n=1 Tax=Abyssisolibacter fermentans TaxID=1766203 RepID=UPI0009EC79A5|nr:gluconeogenesis factor YvcK family protein [Abyssisolibacter fermentans]